MNGPRTSVVVHPPEIPLMIIRQDYKVICCGNSCAAGLLNVFEHWANSVGKETWIYRSQEGLCEDMIGEYGVTTIKNALEDLIEWGYIERRNNPELGFDRKYQYRLRIDNIHSAIRYFYGMETPILRNAFVKSNDAIEETCIETKEKNITIAANGDGDVVTPGLGGLSRKQAQKSLENGELPWKSSASDGGSDVAKNATTAMEFTIIEMMQGHTKTKDLTEAMIDSLNQEVSVLSDGVIKLVSSPNALWEKDMLFQAWVTEVCAQRCREFRMSRADTIKMIRNYQKFYEWRKDQPDTQAAMANEQARALREAEKLKNSPKARLKGIREIIDGAKNAV